MKVLSGFSCVESKYETPYFGDKNAESVDPVEEEIWRWYPPYIFDTIIKPLEKIVWELELF